MEAPARLTGAQRTDPASDQPTARRAAPLGFAGLQQSTIHAESDHDRADTEGERGENREVWRRIGHLGRIFMLLLRPAQPSSYLTD